jgi:multicomponent K+:H+ antiporter subunit A
MSSTWLVFPLAICLTTALISGVFGNPGLRERLSAITMGWLLAVGPFAAFALIFSQLHQIEGGAHVVWRITWMPTIGLNLALYLDGLSALFALLITGIGTLIMIYTGYYFKGQPDAWKFMTYMLLFMTSMLGVVLAGDLISLIVFWEATSITSFLLIGYKTKDSEARRAAFKSLFITGFGGVGLLAGLVFVATITGSYEWTGILASGEALRDSALYPITLGLLAIGAMTKSAQTPAHIWLPDAMSAPTPASAYLHSATMVKAGIYLMARINPVMGFTDTWFWVLSLFGLVTMLTGAYLGLKQNDLKALLAYSTISQLGMLMLLIGQETSIAYKALVIGIIAHALYKCALFLIIGTVDHETGTRDLLRLGGIYRLMPATFAIGLVAALSMAGLPPLFGFIAKETLLATVAHPGLTRFIDVVFPAAAVIGGALIMAQAGLLVIGTFLGDKRDETIKAHDPATGMLLAPAIPAILSLALGILPEPFGLAAFVANAAEAAFSQEVEVVIAIWAGINVPLVLSVIAITIGLGILRYRSFIRARMQLFGNRITLNRLYNRTIELMDSAAYQVARVQNGKLRLYLVIMFLGMGALVGFFEAIPALMQTATANLTPPTLTDELAVLKMFALVFIIVSAFASIFVKRDLPAIIAVGASGLSVAILMVLEPAPDIALVQVVVDILLTIILVLLLTRLPRLQREQADEFTYMQSKGGLLRDALIATGAAAVMTFVVLGLLVTRPRQSLVTPFYEQVAQPLTGARDIVGAIVLDFRAFDTFFEIAVFGIATIGIYTLLRYASREAGDEEQETLQDFITSGDNLPKTMGIGGLRSSPFVRVLAYAILPLSLIVAVTHVAYGHDQPGDGFTAGVIVSLAVGLWYVVLGYRDTKARLSWLRSIDLIGFGLLLVVINSTASALITGALFAPVDYSEILRIPLPPGFHLSSSFIFEVAIFLTVLGGATLIIDTLGRPTDIDFESMRKVDEITGMEMLGQVTREDIPERFIRTK